MRNSIFKSYTKKILRSEAFVSVIIVFVLALGIIGTSYALYMDVDSETDYQLVEVGDLSVSFEAPNGVITMENMLPMEDADALNSTENIFQFYIYNTGSYMIDYDINLIPVSETNTIEPQFINYQICRDNSENCSEVKTLGTVNEDDSVTINNPIYNDSLAAKKENEQTNPSAYYFLRIWLNNKYENEASGVLQYRVEINAKNISGNLESKKTLAGAILNNPNIKINNNEPVITGISSEEEGLYKIKDDYGTSYYFRGKQSNNYVNFAGFTWRVVRINGDGSIRLILNGTLNKVIRETETEVAGDNSPFNTLNNDNAYIGYMYGLAGTTTEANRCLKLENATVTDIATTYQNQESCENAGGKWTTTAYQATHANLKNSDIKTVMDAFYEKYIENNENNYHYGKYLSDTLFCGDKSISPSKHGYGTISTYYDIQNRLFNAYSVNLKCAEGATDDYSRYTVESSVTNSGSKTNGDLTYPIGLLSGDELVLAGAFTKQANRSYYLFESDSLMGHWYTMSPYSYDGASYIIISYTTSNSLDLLNTKENYGIRPVINLKSDTLISGGNGTSVTPYTIKYN